MHLQPRVLRAQPGQFHLFWRHRLGTGRCQLAGSRCFHPVAQRPFNQAKLLGGHHNAHRLRMLDGLFLELGRVLLLRYLLHFSSFKP
jgi:hypothetical protein